MTFSIKQSSDGTTSMVSAKNGKTAEQWHPDFGNMGAIADFVTLFDDFEGDVLDAAWNGTVGSDPQAVTPTINAQANGVVRLVSGDAGTGAAADGSCLARELNWKGSQGCYIKGRVKLVSSAANVCVNFGFTDTKALETPITISGTTLTTTATDAAVFVFDTAQTNDFWHAQGVKADADTAINNTGIAPTADTYQILEVFIDTAGTAFFWIDGVLRASVANAVTTTVALTPVFVIETRTTATKTADADYIYVTQKRA